MAMEHMYKILLLLQSVAFIVFALGYFQNSGVTLSPVVTAAAKQTKSSNQTQQCMCKEHIIRHQCAAVNDSHASTRGPLTNCSLDDIKKRPGVVLLTTTNLAFLDVTLNMLLSVKKSGVCVNTTVIGEDQKVYEQLSKRTKDDPTVNVLMTDSGEMDTKEHPRSHRSQYYGLMNKRQAYVLSLLEQGYEVLFSDADTFWFRDPFPFFEGSFDISLIDSRSPFGVRTKGGDFCAGFIYFKPTSASLQLVKAWRKILDDNKKKGSYPTDQGVLNGLLKNDKPVYVNIKPLDTNIFPYGPKFYSLLAKKANYSTVVMHAASIRGHQAKVTKFKSSNMWLVNKTTEELLAEKL